MLDPGAAVAAAPRGEHDSQVPACLSWRVVAGHVSDPSRDHVDQRHPPLGTGYLAAPEHDRHLHAFTGSKEASDVTDLHVEVGRPDVGPELHLAD